MTSPSQNFPTIQPATPVAPAAPLGRRAFVGKAIAAAATTALAGSILQGTAPHVRAAGPNAAITAGDIAILKFLAAAELVECDLWQQYCELASNNEPYQKALRRIDPALPDYICQDFYDECSHAQWINGYLSSIGEDPVNLDAFRTLPSSAADGALRIGRLTSLASLTVDTSFYNRYRADLNPDLGDTVAQVVTITAKPTVPLVDKIKAADLQLIAHSAAFHFAAIEQGGSSLYNTLIGQVTNLTVLRVLASIGSTEVYHFAAFQSSLEGIFKLGKAPGLNFPAINKDPNRGKIMPKPCKFLDPAFPVCSVIRPRTKANSGALAAAVGLVNSGLFTGQPQGFFDAVVALAQAADAAVRG